MKIFKKGRKSRKSEFEDKLARSDMPAKSDQNNNKIPRKTKKAEKCRLEKEDFYPKRKGKTLFFDSFVASRGLEAFTGTISS